MGRRLVALPIALLGLLAPLGAAFGQVSLITPVSAYYDWEYDVVVEGDHQFDAGIDLGGRFSVTRFSGAARLGGPFSQNIRLFADLAYANSDFDFGQPIPVGCPDPAACFTGSPWQTVNRVDIAPGAGLVLTDRVHVLMIVPMRWSFESGSSASGFTGGFIGALRLQLSDTFTTTLGVGVMSELEASAAIFPVVGLEWRLGEGLMLETRGTPYEGGEGALVWGRSDAVQLRLAVGYEVRRFRLARDVTDPDGVGEYTAVPILAGVRIHLGRQVEMALDGGIAVGGELTLRNAQGYLLRKEGFDTAGLLRGTFAVRW